MSSSSKVTARKRVQIAALPYRVNVNSQTDIMLVTSRETRRWIIPKGWPQKGKALHRSAAREAFEEAGVIGTVGRRSVGSFPYEKRLKDGEIVACDVLVFPLKVKRQNKEWPEKTERKVKWLPAREAAKTMKDPILAEIIRRLARKDVA
jgi:8-oxo-dGTP pyrophosphatase MutT (NUDIX family)